MGYNRESEKLKNAYKKGICKYVHTCVCPHWCEMHDRNSIKHYRQLQNVFFFLRSIRPPPPPFTKKVITNSKYM